MFYAGQVLYTGVPGDVDMLHVYIGVASGVGVLIIIIVTSVICLYLRKRGHPMCDCCSSLCRRPEEEDAYSRWQKRSAKDHTNQLWVERQPPAVFAPEGGGSDLHQDRTDKRYVDWENFDWGKGSLPSAVVHPPSKPPSINGSQSQLSNGHLTIGAVRADTRWTGSAITDEGIFDPCYDRLLPKREAKTSVIK